MTQHPIIIIGAGLASYQLARELRRINKEISLIIITADDGHFYSKPQISSALTSGKNAKALATASAEQMAEQLNATILTHHVATRIDASTHTIWVGQQAFSYSKLVLACGAEVIKPLLTGSGADEVLSINHLYHYGMFQEIIQKKKHITILGAGLIGCEFANDLLNAGYHVEVVAPTQTPLASLMPAEVGKLLQDALAKHGVIWHLGLIAEKVEKHETGYLLSLSDGSQIKTDVVLSAIGLLPHTALAKTAELATGRGILVSRYLETSVKDIYALGDCAEVEGHVLPYIAPLLLCARALAKTLAGELTCVEYPAMPVVVKTPIHPLVICPPPANMPGVWQIDKAGIDVRALFVNSQGKLAGFVLTNNAVKDKMTLANEIPPLF